MGVRGHGRRRVRARRSGLGEPAGVLLRRRSGGVLVFVDESTEDSPSADPVDRDRFGRVLVDAGGEDLVEGGDEHGGVVSYQEPEWVDIESHGEVAGGLGAPAVGEMAGDPGEDPARLRRDDPAVASGRLDRQTGCLVRLAGSAFDEEQHVELAEPDGVENDGLIRPHLGGVSRRPPESARSELAPPGPVVLALSRCSPR